MNMGKTGAPGRMRGAARAALCGLALLAAGCVTSPQEWVANQFKVGPNYHKPAAPVAANWIDAADPRVKTTPPELAAWWRVFDDPILERLIEQAYGQNLDVQTAATRILQARAQRAVAAGQLFPQTQQLLGSYNRMQVSRNAGLQETTPEIAFNDWQLGPTLSWELDFWGRYRRGIEAANADLNASVEGYDDAVVLLVADVANTYVQLRTLQSQVALARKTAESQKGSYEIAYAQFKGGNKTLLDPAQAESNWKQTEALIPPLEASLRQANNRLCTLLGLPPRDLLPELGPGETPAFPQGFPKGFAEEVAKVPQANRKELTTYLVELPRIPMAADDVAVGLPADLLRQRPDVRRAEREAAAQCARVGVAEADLYPAFFITGNLVVESAKLSNLFAGESIAGNVGPSFQWNVLNYGRILNAIRIEDARFQELVLTYQNTVLRANREAEDSLIAFLKTQEQYRRQFEAVRATAQALDVALTQWRQGATDFTTVFTLQSQLTTQLQQLATARGDVALNLVGVYRALGGGWQVRLRGVELGAPAPLAEAAPAPAPGAMPGQVFQLPEVPPRPEFGRPVTFTPAPR